MDNRTQENIENIRYQMSEHNKLDDKRFAELGNTLSRIEHNHLAHIEKYMYELSNKFIETNTNVKWLMKTYWIVVAGLIGVIITTILK